MAQQKSRKDLVHGRAFTTVSTKHTAASNNRKTAVIRSSRVGIKNGRNSSSRSIRTLTFESLQGDQQTDEDSDVLSVKAVPSNFVSVSKPSLAIERLMSKKKHAHETCLEEMKTELAAVHEECADEFQERSDGIKFEIDTIRKDIEEEQHRIQNADLLKLNDDDLQTSWDFIMRMITRERSCIDHFHDQLGEIEHNRQLLVKEVMQKHYDDFQRISYASLVDIQALLAIEIQDYNKIVLTNFKAYEDLYLQMSINAENWSKELLSWFEALKKRRSDEIRRENLKQLINKKESLERTADVFLYDQEGLASLKNLSSALNVMDETIVTWQSKIIIFDALSVSECSEQFNEAVIEVHFLVTKLIDSYKSVLQTSLDKYRNEIDYFKEDNDNFTLDEDVESLDNSLHSLESCYGNAKVEFKDLWKRHLSEIESSMSGFCRFFQDFNSIWLNQASRLNELQEKTGNIVDELTAKNQKSIEELEKKVNAYSQQLRQSSNEEKMKPLLSQISSTLDLIAEKYKFIYEEECKAVKKYIETVAHEVTKITTEFNSFLDTYGPASFKKNVETDTQESDSFDFVRKQLILCQNLVSTVVDWKATLLSEILEFRDNFAEEIRCAAQIWEDTMFSQRASVLQRKLDEHAQRCENIKSEAYNVRIEEIQFHLKQLEDHETEVNETVKDASNRSDEFLQKLKQSLEMFDREMTQLSENFQEARSSVAMKRLQKEIERIRDEYKTEFEEKERVFREELQDTLESLMNKNNNFLNELRSFKDGGTFSVDEVKSHRKSLISCGKIISKAKTTSTQKIDKAVKEINQMLEKSYKTNLERSKTAMKEFTFYEDAQKILAKCASILERQVYRLLEDDTLSINAVFDYINESANTLCPNFEVNTFADQCTRLLDLLEARLNQFTVVFPIVKEIPNDQVKTNRKISVPNKRKKQKSVSKAINYRSLFISVSETPESKNCFATAAINTMLKTIDEIQNEAKNFFLSTGKRADAESSFHEYMQQILNQMKYYRERLQAVWLQEVQDLLVAAEAFDQSIWKCIRGNFDECHDQQIRAIFLLKENKLKALGKTIRLYFTRRSELLDSLEMAHGNPEKKDSLDELTDQVFQEEESMENTISNEAEEFKSELEDLVGSYEFSLLQRAEPLERVMSDIKNQDNKRKRLKELIEKRKFSALPRAEEVSYRLDIATTSGRRHPEYQQQTISSTDNLNIKSLLSNFLEESESIYRSTVREVEAKVEEFLKTGEDFRKNWKTNVATVIEMYALLL